MVFPPQPTGLSWLQEQHWSPCSPERNSVAPFHLKVRGTLSRILLPLALIFPLNVPFWAPPSSWNIPFYFFPPGSLLSLHSKILFILHTPVQGAPIWWFFSWALPLPVSSFLWELHCFFSLIYCSVLLPCALASFSSPTRSEHLRAGFSPPDNLLNHPNSAWWSMALTWRGTGTVHNHHTEGAGHASHPPSEAQLFPETQLADHPPSRSRQPRPWGGCLLLSLIPFKGGSQSPNKEKCSQAWELRKWREAAPGSCPRETPNLAQRLNINII